MVGQAVCAHKRDYALAAKVEYEEHDAVRGRAVCQRHGDRVLGRTGAGS